MIFFLTDVKSGQLLITKVQTIKNFQNLIDRISLLIQHVVGVASKV